MQQLSILLLIALAVASTTATANSSNNLRSKRHLTQHHHQQHRELNGFTDGFSNAWYTLLNAVHMPCPHKSTDDKPLGHCAHHSHHKKPSGGGSHHSSSGGSSTEKSSGCSDECEEGNADCTPCEEQEVANSEGDCECDDDDEDCMKGCEEAAVWQDDGHTDDSTDDVWQDDGHTDDASAVAWDDDGHTDDSTDDNGSSWGYSFNSAQSSNNSASGSGGNSNGMVWGIAGLVAGLVGIAAFVGMRKRKRSDEDNDRDIPEDVYVEGVDGLSEGDAASEYEMKSTRSGTSRAQTIKSALSRGGASIKSKFSRNRSGNLARNQEPLAPMHEGGFEDETINTNDQEGVMM